MKCKEGKSSSVEGANYAGTCQDCDPGKYTSLELSLGNSEGSSFCTACVAGKFNTDTGGTSEASCSSCDSGKYSPIPGAVSSEERNMHRVVCGKPGFQCEDKDFFRLDTDPAAVRCCSGTDKVGWTKREGCDVWAESDHEWPQGLDCSDSLTFEEAEVLCAEVGGRLCTAEEVAAGCTAGTGCDFDVKSIWTSTPVPTCNNCPPGRYNEGEGKISLEGDCQECEAGKSSSHHGAKTRDRCDDCAPGEYR